MKNVLTPTDLTLQAHQHGDHNCGRDWNTEQGCGCAVCRTARSEGIKYAPRTFVVCDGYHRRQHKNDFATHKEAQEFMDANPDKWWHIVDNITPPKS